MTEVRDRLYDLLPAVYRVRDAAQGEPLRALLRVIEREMAAVESDIAGLYDDWFIETCHEWVVPYLGALLGVRGVRSAEPGAVPLSQRAFVANTLGYRRGKGTAATLEQLARDVTGWPARTVEFFELLATTQHLDHVRPQSRTVDLRERDEVDLIGSPFDTAAHTADVRHVDNRRGRHNIHHVGIFLWRLQSYPADQVPAEPAGTGLYRFSSLGRDIPLFTRPESETEIAQRAGERNVPAPIRTAAFHFDVRGYQRRHQATPAAARPEASDLYGADRSVLVVRDGVPVAPMDVDCMDLSGWARPAAGRVGIDVSRGRLAFADGDAPAEVLVSYAYGFSADTGGGAYDRRADLAEAPPGVWAATVSQEAGAEHSTLASALAGWADPAGGNKRDAVITIADGAVYAERIAIEPAAGTLVIQARDGVRPVVRPLDAAGDPGEITVGGGAGEGASVELNGILVQGGLRIAPGSLGRLRVRHSTFVPGRTLDETGAPEDPHRPSIVAESPNARLEIEIDRSITGSLVAPEDAAAVRVRDAIIDSPPIRRTPALVSGGLGSFPALTSPSPSLDVTIGDEGPRTAHLAGVPATLAEARNQLQTAIRAASSTRAFSRARVLTAGNRLVVVPGTAARVTIAAAGGDPTAAELKLERPVARGVAALVTAPLSPFTSPSAAAPVVSARIGTAGPHDIALSPAPSTVVQARDRLQDALKAAPGGPAFADALVASADDRLFVLAGVEGAEVSFTSAASDATTAPELGLTAERPAVSGPGPGGWGPPASFERSTVLGSAAVREVGLASESIFTGPIVARRRQIGCARFSYLAEGSHVPRTHRCVAGGGAAGIRPQFTSTRYGDAGYAQLARACPAAVARGAGDEGEMGAFNFLRQAQRVESVRVALDEYLRFGLEAGMFFVT